jgi:hypothetical protein
MNDSGAHDSEILQQGGVKRSSSSPIEDDIVLHGGQLAAKKRLRISSDSEDSDVSGIREVGITPFRNDFSSTESSRGVLADVVAWICDSCDQNAVKGIIEGLGGKVVTDYLSTRITHFIIDVSRFTHQSPVTGG